MSFHPYWEDKCWGRVHHVFASRHAAVSHLKLDEGFRCSMHRHDERANQFCVHEGAVVIEVWDSVTAAKTMHLLHPGDVFVVPSGIWHRFRVLQNGTMTEVYWPDQGGVVRIADIEREDNGGEDNLQELKQELSDVGLL